MLHKEQLDTIKGLVNLFKENKITCETFVKEMNNQFFGRYKITLVPVKDKVPYFVPFGLPRLVDKKVSARFFVGEEQLRHSITAEQYVAFLLNEMKVFDKKASGHTNRRFKTKDLDVVLEDLTVELVEMYLDSIEALNKNFNGVYQDLKQINVITDGGIKKIKEELECLKEGRDESLRLSIETLINAGVPQILIDEIYDEGRIVRDENTKLSKYEPLKKEMMVKEPDLEIITNQDHLTDPKYKDLNISTMYDKDIEIGVDFLEESVSAGLVGAAAGLTAATYSVSSNLKGKRVAKKLMQTDPDFKKNNVELDRLININKKDRTTEDNDNIKILKKSINDKIRFNMSNKEFLKENEIIIEGPGWATFGYGWLFGPIGAGIYASSYNKRLVRSLLMADPDFRQMVDRLEELKDVSRKDRSREESNEIKKLRASIRDRVARPYINNKPLKESEEYEYDLHDDFASKLDLINENISMIFKNPVNQLKYLKTMNHLKHKDSEFHAEYLNLIRLQGAKDEGAKMERKRLRKILGTMLKNGAKDKVYKKKDNIIAEEFIEDDVLELIEFVNAVDFDGVILESDIFTEGQLEALVEMNELIDGTRDIELSEAMKGMKNSELLKIPTFPEKFKRASAFVYDHEDGQILHDEKFNAKIREYVLNYDLSQVDVPNKYLEESEILDILARSGEYLLEDQLSELIYEVSKVELFDTLKEGFESDDMLFGIQYLILEEKNYDAYYRNARKFEYETAKGQRDKAIRDIQKLKEIRKNEKDPDVLAQMDRVLKGFKNHKRTGTRNMKKFKGEFED